VEKFSRAEKATNGNIQEKKIVRQVSYLQRLYRDARSKEHKILEIYFHF